jgi:hypothetical protein
MSWVCVYAPGMQCRGATFRPSIRDPSPWSTSPLVWTGIHVHEGRDDGCQYPGVVLGRVRHANVLGTTSQPLVIDGDHSTELPHALHMYEHFAHTRDRGPCALYFESTRCLPCRGSLDGAQSAYAWGRASGCAPIRHSAHTWPVLPCLLISGRSIID